MGQGFGQAMGSAARGVSGGLEARRAFQIMEEERERAKRRDEIQDKLARIQISTMKEKLDAQKLMRELQEEMIGQVQPGQNIPGTGAPPQMLQQPSPQRPMQPMQQRLGQMMPGGIGQMFQQQAQAGAGRPGIVQPGTPAQQYSPMQSSMWEMAVRQGQATPELAAQTGITPESQMSPYMRRQQGLERTKVGEQEWQEQRKTAAAQRYAAYAGVDIAKGTLELSRLELAQRKEIDAWGRTNLTESEKQELATRRAIAELQAKTQVQVAGMPARTGGGGEPKPAITLTSINVQVERLRNRLYGGSDPISGQIIRAMAPKDPQRPELERELKYWQGLQALQGGPPQAGAPAGGGTPEGAYSPARQKYNKLRNEGKTAQQAQRESGWTPGQP